MPKIPPRILKGFRDYLPEEMLPREKMFHCLREVFQSYGFLPLMTPALEYADILLGKYGDEGDSLLYRFLDNGERDVALRYDLTVPLARVVAQYPDLPLPFRRYQISPVWRAEKPARGRFREFVQCDGDIIGCEDLIADAEVIEMGAAMLRSLGLERFKIRVNNRKVLSGLMQVISVPGAQESLEVSRSETGVLRTIDKLPKIGWPAVRELLEKENALNHEQRDRLEGFLRLGEGPSGSLRLARDFFKTSELGRRGVEELEFVLEFLAAAGLSSAVVVDLSIARGLNYYTGTIYETFLEDLPGFGAVMSGGRYDGLIGTFASRDIPGVGISLGIDRLLSGLQELHLIQAAEPPAAVLVTIFDEDFAAEAARLSRWIRQAGIACELYPEVARLKKQLRYAERTGKKIALISGPDEAAKERVQAKDLASRSQVEVPRAELIEWLKGKLNVKAG